MKFPFHEQYDSMDCGACCLQMLAEYYGAYYSLEEMRQMISVGVDGVSLLRVSKAAESIGFKTIGGKLTFEKLANNAVLPCIVYWDQAHFVILYKVSKHIKNVILHVADPALGLVQYSREQFCSHWISTRTNNQDKGVVLLLEPTSAFQDIQPSRKNHRGLRANVTFLSKYFRPYKSLYFQIIIGLIVGCIIQLAFPFLTQSIVDKGVEYRDIHYIWLILAAQLSLILGSAAIDFIRRKILLFVSTRINLSLISDFFIKLMKLPMRFFDTKHLGDLLQRIEDHKRVENFLSVQTLNLIFSLLTISVFGGVLFVYNKLIFIVFVVSGGLYCFWTMSFLKRRRVLDYQYFEQQSTERNITYQLINGMQEIKLQNYEQLKRWDWEDIQADKYDISVKSLSLTQAQEAGGVLIKESKNILITAFTAISVVHGDMSIGMMLAVQYIIGQLNEPLEQLMNFIYQWQDVSISLERMNEIHQERNEDSKERNTTFSDNINRDITINNITFQYNGIDSPIVLDNVSLSIPKNKITAIVGSSGSGKTTLVKLLLGYYSVTKGNICIGKDNIDSLELFWWRSVCGAVMQDGYIFSDSIARNIALADMEIDIDKLRSAARIANIDTFIESLPLGYNTQIGQDGQSLSQGQRQRVLIARVIYKNPSYVFFDEATNSLDANNERTITENLKAFYEGKTVIVVAHRLSTVKNADNIVVLESGRIVEQGTHNQLIEQRGAYFNLVKNQLELGN